jgi:ER membrane protein complex subunit 2
LYEQVYIAALECGDVALVDECSKHLNKKFPDSIRVKRLLGMQYEYNKEYKKALDLYDSLLQKNPSHLLILKRKVSLKLYGPLYLLFTLLYERQSVS